MLYIINTRPSVLMLEGKSVPEDLYLKFYLCSDFMIFFNYYYFLHSGNGPNVDLLSFSHVHRRSTHSFSDCHNILFVKGK